jgi:amino acid transporter
MATDKVVPLQSSGQSGTRLRAGAIGLGGATMQAVATIAPAIAGLFFTQYVVSLTGVTAPLAYVLGVCIVLMLGSTLVQLSKHMSSAGGYYTFVSRAINPRVGFLTAWMYVFYNPLCAGPIYAYFGYILQQELKTQYGINAPYLWWLCLVTGAPFVAFLAWRGLALSVRVLVGLGSRWASCSPSRFPGSSARGLAGTTSAAGFRVTACRARVSPSRSSSPCRG